VRDAWHTGHVIDRACGGSDDWDNLRPEHKGCNLGYAAKVGNKVAAKIKRVRQRHLGCKGETPWAKRYREAKEWKKKHDDR
jgi:hypothetical protein